VVFTGVVEQNGSGELPNASSRSLEEQQLVFILKILIYLLNNDLNEIV